MEIETEALKDTAKRHCWGGCSCRGRLPETQCRSDQITGEKQATRWAEVFVSDMSYINKQILSVKTAGLHSGKNRGPDHAPVTHECQCQPSGACLWRMQIHTTQPSGRSIADLQQQGWTLLAVPKFMLTSQLANLLIKKHNACMLTVARIHRRYRTAKMMSSLLWHCLTAVTAPKTQTAPLLTEGKHQRGPRGTQNYQRTISLTRSHAARNP